MTSASALARQAIAEQHAAQKPRELERLAEWLAGRPAPARVLEVGVYLAGTAWLWRALWPEAELVGVDLRMPPCEPCDHRRAHRDCPRRRRREAGMALVIGDSADEGTARRVWFALGGECVDFLHIDGDHSYDGVRRDFELYKGFVAPGGAIALHDAAGEAFPGVVRFWQELEREHSGAFLIHEPANDWGGLGVIPIGARKRGEPPSLKAGRVSKASPSSSRRTA